MLGQAHEMLSSRHHALVASEDKLARERILLNTLVDGMPDLFWIKDHDHRIVRVNRAARAFFGDDAETALVGKSDHDLMDAAHADEFRAREAQVLATGEPMIGVVEETPAWSGGTRNVLSTKYALRDPGGEIIGLVGILRDVTDRIEGERALAASEARFRKLIQHSTDYLLIVDQAARIRWMSPSVERALGRRAEHRIGQTVFDHLVVDDIPAARALQERALATPGQTHSFLAHVRAADRSVRAILMSVTNLLDSEVAGIVLNGRDVTETLQAEEALKASRESARIALDAALMAPWRYDRRNHLVSWTSETAARFGLPDARMSIDLNRLAALVHPADRGLISKAAIERQIASGKVDLELRTLRADGTFRWLHVMGQPARESENGEMVTGVAFDITPRKQIEASLQRERAILDALVNESPDAIYLKDVDSRFVRVNRRLTEHFGFTDPSEMVGLSDFDLYSQEIAARYFADEQRVIQTGEPIVNRLDRQELPGRVSDAWALTNVAAVRGADGQITGVIGTSRDVTSYTRDARELAVAEQRYRLVVELLPAVTCLFTVENDAPRIDYVSPQVESMFGFEPEEFVALCSAERYAAVHPDDRERVSRETRVFAAKTETVVEYRHATKSGGWKWVREVSAPLPGESMRDRRGQSIIFDLTEDRALTERLEHQVFHDSLTGLPNRVMLAKRLDDVIAAAELTRDPFALLFIDLDDFKRVNDSLGHQSGDRVLSAVADRLSRLTRQGDTVARLGGDEFVVLLTAINGLSDVGQVAARVQRAFEQPFDLDGVAIRVTPSIGVSIYSEPGGTSSDMLRDADAAMYAAKRSGRGRTRFFDVTLGGPAREFDIQATSG
jgi:diguanylate cyclase (GGDEF)-like protein/PAS domain S-box-containing protein